uniref:Large ribosomal subunit protein P2 n=2 Tax=Cyclopterus lumpus TaxID=8103 RepID=A0A8C2WJP1_CYCLU
ACQCYSHVRSRWLDQKCPMRYVAAYLLAALSGNDKPASKDLKKILESVGIEADDTRMNKVISELAGKNVEEVIATGYGKLASVPAGGAVAVASSAAAGSGGAAAPAGERCSLSPCLSPLTTLGTHCLGLHRVC